MTSNEYVSMYDIDTPTMKIMSPVILSHDIENCHFRENKILKSIAQFVFL